MFPPRDGDEWKNTPEPEDVRMPGAWFVCWDSHHSSYRVVSPWNRQVLVSNREIQQRIERIWTGTSFSARALVAIDIAYEKLYANVGIGLKPACHNRLPGYLPDLDSPGWKW